MTITDSPYPAAQIIRAAGEALLVSIALLTVWPFGSVETADSFNVTIAVTLLAALWAAHAVITRSISIRPDSISVGLAGIILWSAFQLVPLPEAVVSTLSPQRVEWHRSLLPEVLEQLPGEDQAVPRPASLTLSVNPAATRAFLADVMVVLVVYLVARNWIASRDALWRLAWAAAITGFLLALLAIGQFMSSPKNMVYWRYEAPGQVFGPFVCRNHYPDYQNLCLGLAAGLALAASSIRGQRGERADYPHEPQYIYDDGSKAGILQLLTNPQLLGLTLVIGLIAVSVPFSMSRGGVLATIAAVGATWALFRFFGASQSGGRLWVLPALLTVGLGFWFGLGAVEQRLSTLWTGQALDSRLPLWQDAVRLIPGSWRGGIGANTFQWAEPTVRRNAAQNLVFDSAHNEYLEALIEGGIVRLGFTLLMVGGALWVIGRGYLRLRAEPVGPLILGAWFGLAALALHCFGDFGIRIPAIGLLAAVVAGYAMEICSVPAVARQKARYRVKIKKRVRVGGAVEGREVRPAATATSPTAGAVPSAASVLTPDRTSGGNGKYSDSSPSSSGDGQPKSRWSVRGPGAVVLAGCVVLAAAAAATDARSRMIADRYKKMAGILAYRGERAEFRIPYEEARVAARPNDADALVNLAAARFAAALHETADLAAVAAGPAAYAIPAPRFPEFVQDKFANDGLRAARAARSANPLHPRAHHLLGVYGQGVVNGEPELVHFERAKRLLAVDPFIWYRTGLAAFDKGDLATAWDNWKESLARGKDFVGPIVRRAASKMTPDELMTRLLTDDPAVLVAAASGLDGADDAIRRPFLLRAVEALEKPDLSLAQLLVVTGAATDLGDLDRASAAWERVLELAPNDMSARGRYVSWLEQQERYAEAVPHLEWMVARAPRNTNLQDRLQAARHGVELAEILKD